FQADTSSGVAKLTLRCRLYNASGCMVEHRAWVLYELAGGAGIVEFPSPCTWTYASSLPALSCGDYALRVELEAYAKGGLWDAKPTPLRSEVSTILSGFTVKVEAELEGSGIEGVLTLGVSPERALRPFNRSVAVAGALTVGGAGAPGERIKVYVAPKLSKDFSLAASTITGLDGRFNATLSLEGLQEGAYAVKAECPGMPGVEAYGEFTVYDCGFTLAVSPRSVEAKPGSNVTVTVSVLEEAMWPAEVALSPSPANHSWHPGFLEPRLGVPPFTSTWTIKAPPLEGTYLYAVVGESIVDGEAYEVGATLTLTVAGGDGFAVAVEPQSMAVALGSALNVAPLVKVSASPSWSSPVSLTATAGVLAVESGMPNFTSTWIIDVPSAPGTYRYAVSGVSRGLESSAEFTLSVYKPSEAQRGKQYCQGYMLVVHHYYAVEGYKLEVRYTTPVDVDFEDPGSALSALKAGFTDEWTANKLAYGDFLAVVAYAELSVELVDEEVLIDSYLYEGSWHSSPPEGGALAGYVKLSEVHQHHPAHISLRFTLPSSHFWAVNPDSPYNWSLYVDGASASIDAEAACTGLALLGRAGPYRVKTWRALGAAAGEGVSLKVNYACSWSNGLRSASHAGSVDVAVAWIKPEVVQVWESPHGFKLKVYGRWSDDGSYVTARPYLHYGLDHQRGRTYMWVRGLEADGRSYSLSSEPVSPIELRPPANSTFKVTHAHTEMALMNGTAENVELALSTLRRDGGGVALRAFKLQHPYAPLPQALITLTVKDLDSGAIIYDQARRADPSGSAAWSRGELGLPQRYELWAYAWGAADPNTIYTRGCFGGILLERAPPTP
ncbi:MAG: hypothetical protein QXW94_06115, partial [Desulfurococcaceae archaeon]